MPQLGESVTEGTIARWLKAEGDEIEKDEPLAEVDTDKVNAELPSPVAGKIEKFLVSEGDTVDVGTEILLVAVAVEEDESPAAEAPPRESADGEAPPEDSPAVKPEAQPAAGNADGAKQRTVAEVHEDSGNDGRREVRDAAYLRLTRSSPVVRRLAEEHDVDIQEIPGTGIGGRVTKKDIEGYIEEREVASAAAALDGREAPARPEVTQRPEPAPGSAPERERMEVHEGDRVVELTSIRRAIAERMSRSKHQAPHAWSMVEVDVTGLVALRERHKEEFEESEGIKLTYLPVVAKAVVESLKEHPVLNSVWDGDKIILRKQVNLGVAVDLEDALIVPVIPDADELNTLGLARKIDDVVRRARNRQIGPEDVSGGTFTVNNPGALGSVVSVPIINYPQAAILSAEAVVKRPVVVDDAIAVRSMMNLEVSFDHRILDGGAALRFLNAVKQRLESYTLESELG
jgi:2-oxoisovalerate dehydrogenase E2 component (dihydrolipoyl transacylase)